MIYNRRSYVERFVLVAELGSVSAAARRLGLTVAAVSYTIAQLARYYGEPLFKRQRDRMELTPFGAGILEPAKRHLRAIDTFGEEVLAARQAAREEASATEPPVKYTLRIPGDLNALVDARLAELATAQVGGVAIKVSKNSWFLAAAREKKARDQAALRDRLEESGSQEGGRTTGGAPAGD